MRGNILRFIRENELIKPGSTLVCAVSGGKDSVCLLHVMRSLQKELSITVKAAHLNHQLRGEESDRDEAFVRSLCESLSVPLTVSHADVLTRCKETGESVGGGGAGSCAICFLPRSKALLQRHTHRTTIWKPFF